MAIASQLVRGLTLSVDAHPRKSPVRYQPERSVDVRCGICTAGRVCVTGCVDLVDRLSVQGRVRARLDSRPLERQLAVLEALLDKLRAADAITPSGCRRDEEKGLSIRRDVHDHALIPRQRRASLIGDPQDEMHRLRTLDLGGSDRVDVVQILG